MSTDTTKATVQIEAPYGGWVVAWTPEDIRPDTAEGALDAIRQGGHTGELLELVRRGPGDWLARMGDLPPDPDPVAKLDEYARHTFELEDDSGTNPAEDSGARCGVCGNAYAWHPRAWR